MFGVGITTGLKPTRLAEWLRLLLWQCCNCVAKPRERHEQCQQWEFQTVVCVCECPLIQHWTHRAVCMPEAAAAVNNYAGRPEDNVVFSQELDGNSSVCLLHPKEHIQGTWSAVSLHLRQNKLCMNFGSHRSSISMVFLNICRAAIVIVQSLQLFVWLNIINILTWCDMRLSVQTFKLNCVSRSRVCECCFFPNGWLLCRVRGPPTEQLAPCVAAVGYLKYIKESTTYIDTHKCWMINSQGTTIRFHT